jgi:hypothetical protein
VKEQQFDISGAAASCLASAWKMAIQIFHKKSQRKCKKLYSYVRQIVKRTLLQILPLRATYAATDQCCSFPCLSPEAFTNAMKAKSRNIRYIFCKMYPIKTPSRKMTCEVLNGSSFTQISKTKQRKGIDNFAIGILERRL